MNPFASRAIELMQAMLAPRRYRIFVMRYAMNFTPAALACAIAILGVPASASRAETVGIFDDRSDIGATKRAGSTVFDANRKAYTVSGGGANMWHSSDAFHFVWKKVSGDVSLAADISFPDTGGDPHRKACLLVRQSLEADSAYADAVLHGDGLTSLQYRETAGERTYEIQSAESRPKRLRIEKRGRYVSMSVAGDGRPAASGGRLVSAGPHRAIPRRARRLRARQRADRAGSLRQCRTDSGLTAGRRSSATRLDTRNRPDRLEGPTRRVDDNRSYRSAQLDARWPFASLQQPGPHSSNPGAGRRAAGSSTPAFAIRCNNDHGISPDGTSSSSATSPRPTGSRAFTRFRSAAVSRSSSPRPVRRTGTAGRPTAGRSPTVRNATAIRHLHDSGRRRGGNAAHHRGWSRRRPRLLSRRTVDLFQLGSQRPHANLADAHRRHRQEQVTDDDFNNWFPHPSPDGKWLVFLSYEKDVKGHPENKDVSLRIMPLGGGKIEVLARLFGGQGTINVPSWSPDSRRVAFVSYQFVP